MKLRFTARATQDLAAIAEYIRARNPAAALRVRTSILNSLELLLAFPELGRRQNVEGVRKLVNSKYPYLLYYSLGEATDEVIVLAIQHAAREREYEDI
jgi:toxin ParE1/3/4